MELFVVNRHEEDINKVDPEKEDRIIDNIKKNIEKKRKKNREENEIKKKQKLEEDEEKQKLIVEPVKESIENKEAEDDVDDTNTKKKKSKKSQKSGEGFSILPDFTGSVDQNKVKVKLSHWLANPKKINKDLSDRLDLESVDYISATIKNNLKKNSIESLFPVQTQIIPWILDNYNKPSPFIPRDICVSAPTGSGKTFAFAIPIINILQNCFGRKIRAIVVLPVQELAKQVAQVFTMLTENTGVRSMLLSNSEKIAVEQNQLITELNGKYYSKVDIIITTAGRLVEHIHSTKGFSLKSLQFLVVDEADRILDDIQNDWLYHLNNNVREETGFMFGGSMSLCIDELWNSNKPPHKLLFSATLSKDPEKLKNLNLFQPILFTTHDDNKLLMNAIMENGEENDKQEENFEHYSLPAELSEKYCITVENLRPLTVYALIKENNWNRFICFTNDYFSTHRLSFVLQSLFGDEMVIEELSSKVSSVVRKNILDQFISGKVNGVICTDAFARGIDIPNVDVVISYNAPRHVTTYVHRVGRTARAGKLGTAVTILAQNELDNFTDLVRKINDSDAKEIRVESKLEEQNAVKYKDILLQLQYAITQEKLEQTTKSKKIVAQPKKTSLLQKLQNKVKDDQKPEKQQQRLPKSWKR